MLYDGQIIADGDAEYIKNHPHHIVQQFIHGQVGQADLEALRLGGTKFKTQYEHEDFK
jgi:ABC-type transporter Mla maintaining outer membrane lipid asymmetry ATPase subunit MlaF